LNLHANRAFELAGGPKLAQAIPRARQGSDRTICALSIGAGQVTRPAVVSIRRNVKRSRGGRSLPLGPQGYDSPGRHFHRTGNRNARSFCGITQVGCKRHDGHRLLPEILDTH